MLLQTEADNTIVPDEFVEEHNAYRCELGLEPLAWDCELAAASQAYADYQRDNNGCQMAHSTNDQRQTFLSDLGYSSHPGASSHTGENLAWLSGMCGTDCVPQIKNGREVSGMWASEKNVYAMGASSDACTITATTMPNGQAAMVGHYTQMIWHTTTHIGCGVSQCPDSSTLFVCQYHAGGNYVGELPFCKSSRPSNMAACSNLDSLADPTGLACVAGQGACPSDGTVCSTMDTAVTTCGSNNPAPRTSCAGGGSSGGTDGEGNSSPAVASSSDSGMSGDGDVDMSSPDMITEHFETISGDDDCISLDEFLVSSEGVDDTLFESISRGDECISLDEMMTYYELKALFLSISGGDGCLSMVEFLESSVGGDEATFESMSKGDDCISIEDMMMWSQDDSDPTCDCSACPADCPIDSWWDPQGMASGCFLAVGYSRFQDNCAP
jgi:pathogenesis-related protein 1